MIFDTHSHCYWESLLPRIEEVLANMKKAHVEKTVAIGCDIESSKQAIALADRYPEVFSATVGLHPETAQNTNDFAESEFLEKLVISHRESIVAIGETGLDFHYLDGSHDGTKRVDMNNLSQLAKEQIENQKNWWRIQFELSLKYNLPLVIHTRDARDATLAFMKDEGIGRAVMHCFSEDYDFARELLDFSDDIYFSFSGIVTYKNAEKIQEAAKKIPIERILVETDAPFLAPQPVRGQVCEPAFTRYTLERIALLREVSVEAIEDQLFENSLRFYGLQDRAE